MASTLVFPTNKARLWKTMLDKIAGLEETGTAKHGIPVICSTATTPSNDNDLAYANGTLCWAVDASDIYIASNVDSITAPTTTTWTKIVD